MTGYPGRLDELCATPPGVDLVTETAVLIDDSRPVVSLDRWLAAAARCAHDSGRELQVRTISVARLTIPALDLLRTAGCRWVVPAEPFPLHRDALTGHPMLFDGSRWVPEAAAQGQLVPPPTADEGRLVVTFDALHAVEASLEIGDLTSRCMAALTGSVPLGWGPAEPATQPWRPADLTDFVRERVPDPSRLVVVGQGPAVGVLTVSRRPSAVAERLHLVAGVSGSPDREPLERVAAALAESAVRTAVLGLQPGPVDTTTPALWPYPVLPHALLLGPSVVAVEGLETLRRRAGELTSRAIGRAGALLISAEGLSPAALPKLLLQLAGRGG